MIDFIRSLGATPIHYAAQEGHLEAVTFLHSKGKCSLETRVDDGMKPIHAAAQSGHTSIVQVCEDVCVCVQTYCHFMRLQIICLSLYICIFIHLHV